MIGNSPAVSRRVGSQKFLLASYAEVGNLNEALWELGHLHDRDPCRYRQLTGSDELPAYETLRGYWKRIPLARRRAAKQRFLRR